MLRGARKIVECTSGAVMLETALILPLALLICFGVAEFGRAISMYMTVDSAMRGAARYLARVPTDGVPGWGLTKATNLALYGNVEGTGSPLVAACGTPGTCTIELEPDEWTSGTPPSYVRLVGTFPLQFEFLPVIGRSAALTFTVTHEEVCVPE
jgi:hypothetical protein